MCCKFHTSAYYLGMQGEAVYRLVYNGFEYSVPNTNKQRAVWCLSSKIRLDSFVVEAKK